MTPQQAKHLALTSIECGKKRHQRQRRKQISEAVQILAKHFFMVDSHEIEDKLESAEAASSDALLFLSVLQDLQIAHDILQGGSLLSQALNSSESIRTHRGKVWKALKRKGVTELRKLLRSMEEESRTIIVDAVLAV